MGLSAFLFILVSSFSWAQSNLSRRLLDPAFSPTESSLKVLFLDADSTVRVTRGGAPYAQSPTDYYILPGVAEKIRAYNQAGFLVFMISNQGGISGGRIKIEVVDQAFKNMVNELKEKHQARIDYYDFAENKSENDPDRKPAIGMADRLEKKLKEKFGAQMKIDLTHSFMVGDAAYMNHERRQDGRSGEDFSNFDREFARNLGVRYLEPHEFFGWQKYGFERIHKMVDAQYVELLNSPRSCRGRVFTR